MIILFGAAGSGKSVQGKSLADKYGWKWMSVGQLLRDKQSPELEAKMHGGDLVDDRLVVNMMHDGMMEAHYAGQNVILDGYPRDVWQAEWIADHDDTQYIDGAIILDVPHDELWERLQTRGRADDTEDAIRKRWAIFDETISAMSEVLSEKGVKITHVDGVGKIEDVTKRIEGVLGEWGII